MANEEAVLPPGTVQLLPFAHGLTEDGGVILVPKPTNDVNDPLNWPLWRKSLNFVLVTAVTIAEFTLLVPTTTLLHHMLAEMDVSYSDLTNAQAVQLVGLAVGCIVVIPCSQKYGRRSTYIFSTAVLAGVTWWAAYMRTNAEVMVTSVLFGLAGAPNEAVVQMTITDMFFLHQRATANSIYFFAVMIGSFLTPMVAGYQASISGWRESYVALAISLSILTVIFIPLLDETKYIPVIKDAATTDPVTSQHQSDTVQHKSLKPVTKDDHASIVGQVERIQQPSTWRERMRLFTPTEEPLFKTLYYPIYTICLPHVIFTAVQFASCVCWLVVVSSMISIIFSAPPYEFDSAAVGYMFAGPFVGTVFGSIYGGPFLDWAVVRLAKRNDGLFEPEMRLYLFPFPNILTTAGLIMFGITADKGLHWIYPSIGCALFGFGLGASGDICFTMILDAYPELVPEIFVLVTFIRNSISIPGPFSITPWLQTMSISNMFILSGFISLFLGMFCIPYIIWGRRWRVALAPFYHRLCKDVAGTRR
ncbi:major facilitator superfamily domain-containing protein [Pestalotiopsis sp. NC0098]|nr:major facilitator superfamily domain-containing protein [Pestalotiopsis sp. NC0098]